MSLWGNGYRSGCHLIPVRGITLGWVAGGGAAAPTPPRTLTPHGVALLLLGGAPWASWDDPRRLQWVGAMDTGVDPRPSIGALDMPLDNDPGQLVRSLARFWANRCQAAAACHEPDPAPQYIGVELTSGGIHENSMNMLHHSADGSERRKDKMSSAASSNSKAMDRPAE